MSLGLLIFLSFYWYGERTKRLIYEDSQKLGKQLVRTAFAEAHRSVNPKMFDLANADAATIEDEDDEVSSRELQYRELMEEGRRYGTDFSWDTIIPLNSDKGINPPQGEEEKTLLARYGAVVLPPVEERPVEEGQDAEAWLPIEAAPVDRVTEVGGKQTYHYYRPIYAHKQCVQCHRYSTRALSARKSLQEGELLAIMRISFDHQPIADQLAKNTALLITAAVVTGFLSMFMLWIVVRYVVVKPVQHLRDVSNAVREGEVDMRAEIYTGDEFEELAAAFNRMVRQLLRQRDDLTDVNSELDRKLDELAQANMRLYEMNRIKSDFLATMSHELRTPLNSILGFSDVLHEIDSLDDKQKRYVGNIRRSGALLLEMINDILDLAKMESGQMSVRPTEFRIESIISSLCDMARPLAENKNIDLEFSCEPDLPILEQDQAKIQQVLNNLLSNAIKFTPEGGRIAINARRDESDMLEITVEDTGIGISDSDQALVFEKFRQGTAALPGGDAMTREHSGTGLGLSIVRELCRLLGGEVTLSSVVGKGSTFTVTLPWRIELAQDLDAQLKDQVAALGRVHASDYLAPAGSENGTSPTQPASKPALSPDS